VAQYPTEHKGIADKIRWNDSAVEASQTDNSQPSFATDILLNQCFQIAASYCITLRIIRGYEHHITLGDKVLNSRIYFYKHPFKICVFKNKHALSLKNAKI
jgi:hypothetical protein